MKTRNVIVTTALVIGVLAGCSSNEVKSDETADAPTDPLDQMLVTFQVSPSKTEIQEAVDNAMNVTETPFRLAA